MNTFRDVIERWPNAEALGLDVGVDGNLVRQWKRRNSIPPQYWRRLQLAAARQGVSEVSLEMLVKASEGNKSGGEPHQAGAETATV